MDVKVRLMRTTNAIWTLMRSMLNVWQSIDIDIRLIRRQHLFFSLRFKIMETIDQLWNSKMFFYHNFHRKMFHNIFLNLLIICSKTLSGIQNTETRFASMWFFARITKSKTWFWCALSRWVALQSKSILWPNNSTYRPITHNNNYTLWIEYSFDFILLALEW